LYAGRFLERLLKRYALLCVFGAVVAMRLLFLVTFPLNDLGGDTTNYGAMLRDGTSNLVHASGYPYLIGPPLGLAQHLLGLGPASSSYFLLILQHVIDLAVLVLLYRATRDIFGQPTAAFAVLLAGTSVQSLGVTSAVYPEWLQAGLLVIAFAAVYYAYASDRFGRKISLYALASFAFTWCILVKFNAAVLSFVFAAAILAEAQSLRRKAAIAAVCFGVCATTSAFFILSYHRPSTGTYALTHDKAWVLLSRIQVAFDNHLDPRNGPNTRRWLALSSVLPRSYDQASAGLFRHLDAVPPEIRAPYRLKYLHLVTADEAVVNEVLSHSQLPDGFRVGLSAIPVAYYIGLPESDELGVRVAAEAVRAHPFRFATSVWRDVRTALWRWPQGAPFATADWGLANFGATVQRTLPLGFVRLSQRTDYGNIPFAHSVPVLWWPGVRLFTYMNAISPFTRWLVVLAAIATLAAAIRAACLRSMDLKSATTLLLAGVVMVIIVVSSATIYFRWKEARLVFPILSVVAATAITMVPAAAGALAARWRAWRS